MVEIGKLKAVLERAAGEGRALTYGQILTFFGRKVTRVSVGALCRDLGEACRLVEADGGPDLAVLVVRKSDGMPGAGYFTALRREGLYDGADSGEAAAAFVAARQQEVFAWYSKGRPSARRARRAAQRPQDQEEGQDGKDGDVAIGGIEIGGPEARHDADQKADQERA
ncbi:hypothetical protein SAMN07250955_10349 [Arboricoccus pini]|uniref:Uncharacterized protein n=1 Tax=Arboricoccus pini TaxID=1963835 RepID=A0A212QRK7_9PROT|nr:hypothetical protein SAMN07250955_10349 [Arboricoccus pini]